MGLYFDDNKFVMIEPQTFHFYFDLPKDVDKNLKLEIDFVIRHNEYLVKERIKNEIDQLLYRYKHRDNIYEHRKQQKQ